MTVFSKLDLALRFGEALSSAARFFALPFLVCVGRVHFLSTGVAAHRTVTGCHVHADRCTCPLAFALNIFADESTLNPTAGQIQGGHCDKRMKNLLYLERTDLRIPVELSSRSGMDKNAHAGSADPGSNAASLASIR